MGRVWLRCCLLVCVFVLQGGFAMAIDSPYGLQVKGIDGTEVPLEQYRGKVLLIVNTASKCGYTPQYEGLQKLYEKYQEQGLVVLGFPSNDFGGQEPGSNQEIAGFCSSKFEVGFPLFEKGAVQGEGKQELYQYLVENSPVSESGEVKWNFEKFLVARDGKVIARYRSAVEPESSEITSAIEDALG